MNHPSLPIGSGGSKARSNPFFLYSNESFPTDYRAGLDFCAYLYNLNGQYGEASRRVISHFITDIGFEGKKGSPEEQDKWREFLVYDLDCFQTMQNLGDDWSAYGVGFCRINYPFNRYLRDDRVPNRPKLYAIGSFPREHVYYDHKTLKFRVPDPIQVAEGKSWDQATPVEFDFTDKMVRRQDGISLVMLDPRYCRVNFGTMSKKFEVIYQFDPEFRDDIKNNNLFQINQTHRRMLEVIAADGDFRFDEKHVFMFTRPSLTGVSKKGLGIPPPIAHYRELHQLQVYRKIDETIANDYMVPLRLISPGFGSANGSPIDPMFNQSAHDWKLHMGKIIQKWRMEQDSLFAVPYPTQYQELSGNGKALVPKDLMELQMNTLLNSVGYPAELFHGTLQYQHVPTALRIFERSFHFVYHNFNKFVKWVSDNTRQYLRLPDMDVVITPPTIADDADKRALLMQLMAGGEVPRRVILDAIGVKDPVQAYRERLQEEGEFELARMEHTEELERQITSKNLGAAVAQQQEQAAAQGGQAPPGAAPAAAPGGGGGAPNDPHRQWQEAQELAAKWLQMEAEGAAGEKDKEMAQVKASRPDVHALAKQIMEEARSRGASAGRQEASQFV
jgi:hypothetical protein